MSSKGGSAAGWASAQNAADQRNAQSFFADLETRFMTVEKERNDLLEARKKDADTLKELQSTQETLRSQLTKAESDLVTAQRELSAEKARMSNASSEQQHQGERVSRLEAEGDNLREEISRLTSSNKSLREQIVAIEAKAKLNDSAAVPLQFENERLQKEVDSLTAHTQWLDTELATRANELASVRQNHGDQLMRLRQELDVAVEERDSSILEKKRFERNSLELGKKLEQAMNDLRTHELEAGTANEAAEKEIHAKQKLIDLQKDQVDRLQAKSEQMENELSSLREMASIASGKADQELEKARSEIEEESRKVLKEQEDAYREELDRLRTELESESRLRQEAEDGLLGSPSRRGRVQAPQGQRQFAASSEDGPLSLTDMYSRLNAQEDELQRERAERKKAQLLLEKLESDIAAKTPELIRQRQQYEWAMGQQQELNSRLMDTLDQVQHYRSSAQEARGEVARLSRQNHEQQLQGKELAKQVQALLASKAGGEVPEGVPTSIEELQNQNQKLLSEHIRLTTALDELQAQTQSDTTVARLAAAEEELSELKEQREQQEALVAGIVQQRDLYRALVSKQDEGIDAANASQLVVAERTQQMSIIEQRNRAVEQELAKVAGELSMLRGEKSGLEERVARLTMHCTELTSALDKMQVEVSSAKSAASRSEADCTYFKEKATRTDENLEMTRNELNQIKDAKAKLMDINHKQEQTLLKVRADASRAEHEARQAGMKLRLIEAQLSTSKQAEERLSQELGSLRSGYARQGEVLESLQRLEARVSAKNDEEKESMKEVAQNAVTQLEKERAKHNLDIGKLEDRLKDAETKLATVEQKLNDKSTECDAARKDASDASNEVQRVKSRIDALSNELSQARKRLGETDPEDEGHASETEVEKLQAELVQVKKELSKALERSANFQKIAKTNETSLSELSESTKALSTAKEKEIAILRSQLEELKKESRAKEEVVAELTKDLGNHRGEQDKAVRQLKTEIEVLKEAAAAADKDRASALARADSTKAEMIEYQKAAETAQVNYERELKLHATARSDLRAARDAAQRTDHSRRETEGKLQLAKEEIVYKERQFQEELSALQKAQNELKQSLEETRKQNEVLHGQLGTLGEQFEKTQSDIAEVDGKATGSGSEEVESLRKALSELREIVKFMRSERQMNLAHLEAAKREAERERASSQVLKRSVDEVRAELKALQPKTDPASALDETSAARLKEAETQLMLLRESNQLLRTETDKLERSLSSSQAELATLKAANEPTTALLRSLEKEKKASLSEKESLQREVDAWKGRVQSLVSKFNQVDPEEYKRALEEVQALKKERDTATSEKVSALRANLSAKQQIAKLNKDISAQKAMVDQQKTQLAKAKTDAAATKAIAIVTKERDALKDKLQQSELQLRSLRTELKGTNDRNEKLKERMRQFQKMMMDQKAKIAALEKETTSSRADPATATVSEGSKSISVGKSNAVPKSEKISEAPTKTADTTKNVIPNAADPSLPAPPEGGFQFGPSETKAITREVEKPQSKPPTLTRPPVLSKRDKPDVIRKPDSGASTSAKGDTKNAVVAKKQRSATPGSMSPKLTAVKTETAAEALQKAEILRQKIMQAKKKKRALEKKEDVEKSAKQAKVIETETTTESKATTSDEATLVVASVTVMDKDKATASMSSTASGLRASANPFQPSSAAKDAETKGAASFGNPFGAGVPPSQSSFGSKPVSFGSSSSVVPSFGGTSSTSTAPSGGSVFLQNMKPPSASAAPFTFGSSSVKLPIPANPAPFGTASPFGAFSGSNPFGGAASTEAQKAKPLFGGSGSVQPREGSTEDEENKVSEAPKGDSA